MQLQASLRSGNSSLQAAPAARITSRRNASSLSTVILASSLAAIFAATTGCGSGISESAGSTAAQGLAAPVASAKGPQLGYLWVASDKTLRPILGVPGASQIGQSVVPAGMYTGAAASATASVAVLQDSDGAFDLMALPSGSPASLGLHLPVGARILLSPGATAALLYTPGTASASLVTGLLSVPAVHPVAAPGPIADAAVSDTGAVGFEYAQSSSISVSVMALNGRSTPIASVKSIGGLSFLPGKDDLLLADSSANSLTLVRTATTAPSTAAVSTAALLKAPLAIAVSGSGRWAIVVNSAASSDAPSLIRVDLGTLGATAVACSCKPTLASTLADDGAFRVTDAQTGPNWIVDAAQTTPRVLFIPALRQTAEKSLVASAAIP